MQRILLDKVGDYFFKSLFWGLVFYVIVYLALVGDS